MLSRLKKWFFGLSRRKQDYVTAAMILAGLFVLSSPPIAPYFWMVFWSAHILFWIGIVLFVVVGLIVVALTTKL